MTWQGPPVNPPSTPNDFPDQSTPITLTGQIDSSSGAISGASLSLPPIEISSQGQNTFFALTEAHPGTATGTFNSTSGATTLNDTLTLTFSVPNSPVGLIECVSTPITVALSGTWDQATQNVTLATTSSFTIPQFPSNSGPQCSLASGDLNASPGGTAGAVGNAMSIALHGQFAPGLPTTTSLAASPNSPQLAGTAVTLTATVSDPSNQGTPTGAVTFFDNGANVGTGSLSGSGSSPTAALTTSTLPAGSNQQLTATYAGDTTYASSTSSATSYTITPLPAVAATLPTTMTVPSNTQLAGGPVVSGITPAVGPTKGGTSVAITGTGFTGATAVTFGTKAATSFTVNSATSITAISPRDSGTVDIMVTTPIGPSPTSVADQFTYGAPTVTSVAPNAGPSVGGTEVTIIGTGFSSVTAVTFGSTPAASYSVLSPIQIAAVSPAGTGTAHVAVTTNGGTSSAGGAANEFIYGSGPSVASLTPTTGTQGTGVTISGSGFTAANGVYFGSTAASAFTVVNDSTITATAPAGSGAVDVTVSSATGTSATGPSDVFAYGSPTVTNVAPSTGPTSGGTSVVVTGTGFILGATVAFGSTPATSTSIVSPTEIVAVSPAQSVGATDITVTNTGGTSATSPADVFTYSAGGAPGQASLTITNPSAGQSWSNLYLQVVFSGISNQPASNIALSYQDSSGDWCPLALSGTSTITTYFSGVGSSCGDAPGSFSLASGATLSVPIQLAYASGTYMGAQSVTTTLYSGTCSSPTSCTQSGALNGAVAGSSTVELAPLARLASMVVDSASQPASSPVRQGFQMTLFSCIYPGTKGPITPPPLGTGTIEYLVDGNPIALTTDGSTPATNPTPLNGGSGCNDTVGSGKYFFNTSGLSVGTHTLTSVYSGDSVFLPSTLNETFTVLPAPTGVPYSCTGTVSFIGLSAMTSTGYLTATSSAPTPVPSGSTAQVNDASVSLDLDPAVLGGFTPDQLGSMQFSLSPSGSMTGNDGVTSTNDATDVVTTWSGMSAAVPVTGTVGSTVPVDVGSLAASIESGPISVSLTCTPASGLAQLASVPVAGNTLSASPSGSAAPGAPVTLTDTVSPAPPADGSQAGQYGQVTFYDGSSVLGTVPVDATGDAGNGTAALTTNQLAVGDHQLSAQWSGTLSIPANTSNTVDYQVGTASTTTLASSANPANATSPVTFTATVNGSSGGLQPTGDVSFAVDGTAPAACQNVALSTATAPTATCKLSFKAGTTHSVVATYSGDAIYLGSSSDPLSQSMLGGTTSTLTTPKNPAPAGNVTFWDGVAASGGGAVPTGTVAFTVDNKASAACAHQPLGSGGGASCTLSFKAGTTHTVSATYAGSSSYSGSKSNTITLKVSGASSATKPKVTTASATLTSGKTLTAGQSIATGSYKLTMQTDGNLVEYQGSKTRWASGTSGHSGTKVTMQKDGNLVEYQGGKAIWASGTSGHAGAHLTLQGSDGNVVIYGPGGQALWATGT